MESKIRLQLSSLVLAALLVSGCGGVSPSFPVEVAAPAKNSDLEKVDAVAKSLGFVRSEYRDVVVQGHGGRLKSVAGWYLPEHKATYVNLLLVIEQGRYRIFYGDGDVDGWEFTGTSCSRYLDFVAALKKEFADEPYRLSFFSESCSNRK